MLKIDKLVKIGTRDLARNFDKDFVGVVLEPDKEQYHWIALECVQPGDMPFKFYIIGKSDFSDYGIENEYMGQVLVRGGHVHYSDRYPVGGGPFEVKDFKSPDFRKRAELIVKNIDQLLGYDGESAITNEISMELQQLPPPK